MCFWEQINHTGEQETTINSVYLDLQKAKQIEGDNNRERKDGKDLKRKP
jgi:hypothetical protein